MARNRPPCLVLFASIYTYPTHTKTRPLCIYTRQPIKLTRWHRGARLFARQRAQNELETKMYTRACSELVQGWLEIRPGVYVHIQSHARGGGNHCKVKSHCAEIIKSSMRGESEGSIFPAAIPRVKVAAPPSGLLRPLSSPRRESYTRESLPKTERERERELW